MKYWKTSVYLLVLPIFGAVEFNRDIRPILSDKCFSCHGPDSKNRLTRLRFDTEAGAKQDLGGRFAIVTGDPIKSEMIHRITASNPSNRMPPTSSGHKLTENEIEKIRSWVREGAKWQQHWAWMVPKRSELPSVQRSGWCRNAIDRFVLERLEGEGLAPSPEAGRERLIRRVTLDLTGLPPSLTEVDAFLADKSPEAYERVVDRLLASSRYGERMAEHWLDAARYADSHGYQSDGERQMWRWRDWVIDAFNHNMPFDEFTVEQLAGDMLPNATLDQKIASGFNRNHRANGEGGIVPEEYLVEYVVDRVDTTASVWLGVTLGCARCHDHKFDPFSQKEFYQLFAYFNNVPEKGRVRKVGNSEPLIAAPTVEQRPVLRDLEQKAAAAQRRFTEIEEHVVDAQRQWEQAFDQSTPLDSSISRGLSANYSLAGDGRDQPGKDKDHKIAAAAWREGTAELGEGRKGRAAVFDGMRFFDAGKIAVPAKNEKLTLAAWIYPTALNGAIITRAPDVSETRGFGKYMLGYSLHLKAGRLQFNLASRWADNAMSVETVRTLNLNEWRHVQVTYDGSRTADGVHVYLDGRPEKSAAVLDDLTTPPNLDEPLRIGAGGGPANRFRGRIEDVRVYDVELTADEAAIVATPESIQDIIGIAWGQRTKAQSDKIRLYFLERQAPPAIAGRWNELVSAKDAHDKYVEGLPTVMVMQEMRSPRETHVLMRGAYDRPGIKVNPGLPAILPPLPAGVPNNRLGLARWIVDPLNPLTARVTVNRFWEMYFGSGLVKSLDDFGSQGEWPSHPALLDWLATEFVGSGWNVKAMQRLIVTSAAYRQSSRMTPELLQRDPENRLLTRGPRFRLSAEMLRDQALYLAGLMVEKIGGPSVKPYQPSGLWKELLSNDYPQDHGDKLYRRSLYTFWRRTAPPPSLMNFDASGRETCVVRRNRTNTPLQALDLMNDVTYVEAARALAARMMKEGGSKPEERIGFAFRLATARRPTAPESDVLLNSYRYYLDRFLTDRGAAQKYLTLGELPFEGSLDVSELSAYAAIASMIENLDETVTKN